MRLVTFSPLGHTSPSRPGLLIAGGVADLTLAWPEGSGPQSLQDLLEREAGMEACQAIEHAWKGKAGSSNTGWFHPREAIRLLAPIPRPPSVRDFYAFEQHVASANAIRGSKVPSEWYQFPVFYFSSPASIYGPGDLIPWPGQTHELDFELEIACVIGKQGRDIPPDKANEYIAGFCVMNDWSARDLQREEMRVRLGPAKGKDFATSLGPELVTPDELKSHETRRPGVYHLEMTARINGTERSRGNMDAIHYSFGDLLARASADCTLYPGDVIGSGTVGSGCLLELTLGQGPFLQPGDRVELEIECLGTLANQVGEPRFYT